MYGIGILKGLGVTFKHFVDTFVDDIQWLGKRRDLATFQTKQSLANRGLVTVEYPDEKLAMPERFRFIPFLVVYNHDDPEYSGKDWCTSCGICAKVCPPQCIWIVRGTNPETGRPKPEPEQFYIDIDVCMNCGYCAEYCPFDAIKMDHDYELASYDRTSNHIFDHDKLAKEVRYWQTIAPTTAAEELTARGGYDHTDVQKSRKKAGLPASRPGPVSDTPEPPAPTNVPATAPVGAPALVNPEAVAAAPEIAPGRATETQGQQSASAGTPAAAAPAQGAAATTPDGKPIVRRRGAGPRKEGAATPAPSAPTPAPASGDAPPAAAAEAPHKIASPDVQAAPASSEPSGTVAAPDSTSEGGPIKRGPKRVIDPNNPPPVVRRRSAPPKKE